MDLYKHQKDALEKAKDKQQFAFLMDMGTGKTAVALHKIPACAKTLIVTKNSIKHNWRKEIAKWIDPGMDIILEGGTVNKKALLKKKFDTVYFNIINYDYIWKIGPELVAKGFDAMVLDESTVIKNPKAKCTKAIIKISKKIPIRIILTGTPITNNPLDLFTQFYFLDPKIIGFDSFWAFKNYYAVMVTRQFGKGPGAKRFQEVVEYRNIDELKKRIEPWSFIIKKEDCLDLPPKVYERRDIDMPIEMERIYTDLKRHLVAEIEEVGQIVVQNVLSKMIRLQQILGGQGVLEDGTKINIKENKTQEILSILEEIGDNKVVIWCRFVNEIIGLEQILSHKGFETRMFYGAISTQERNNAVQELNTGNVQILICQQQTGGYGIDLTGASYTIYFSNDFSLEHRQQSEDRVYRNGQNKKVTIIDLVTRKSLEIGILDALKEKKKWQDKIMDVKDVKNLLEGGG